MYIQGVLRLQGITVGGDFLGLCDQKSSYKHVSDFGRLRSYVLPPLWSSGQSFWLLTQGSRFRFPALPDFSEQQWVWKGVHSAS
jgi:hypothetical protein